MTVVMTRDAVPALSPGELEDTGTFKLDGISLSVVQKGISLHHAENPNLGQALSSIVM